MRQQGMLLSRFQTIWRLLLNDMEIEVKSLEANRGNYILQRL
jgi:hypothetical protein